MLYGIILIIASFQYVGILWTYTILHLKCCSLQIKLIPIFSNSLVEENNDNYYYYTTQLQSYITTIFMFFFSTKLSFYFSLSTPPHGFFLFFYVGQVKRKVYDHILQGTKLLPLT